MGMSVRACVYVYTLQEGASVWQLERLSLVGGGVVRHCGLPSPSCHKGCEKQIKLPHLFLLLSFLLWCFSFSFAKFSSLVFLLHLQTFSSTKLLLGVFPAALSSCTWIVARRPYICPV